MCKESRLHAVSSRVIVLSIFDVFVAFCAASKTIKMDARRGLFLILVRFGVFDGWRLSSLVLGARSRGRRREIYGALEDSNSLANGYCGCWREFVRFYESIRDRESEEMKTRE